MKDSYRTVCCARGVEHHAGRSRSSLTVQGDFLMLAAALKLVQLEVGRLDFQLGLQHLLRLIRELGRREQHQGLAVVHDVLQLRRRESRRQRNSNGPGRENSKQSYLLKTPLLATAHGVEEERRICDDPAYLHNRSCSLLETQRARH